jgi:hypothetical protein
MAGLKTWSYSAATTFEKCPKQYFHLYVAKDIKQDPNTEHFLYGNEVHKAAELYVRDNVPLPDKFIQFQPSLDRLKQIPGKKYCEHKVGLTRDLEPTGFFDSDVWWRGAIDLLIVNPETKTATVIDYKTGKSSQYADTRQLSLLGAAVFKHFPEVEVIKSGLVFLVSKEILKEDYKMDNFDDMIGEWDTLIKRMDVAYETNVFNAAPNFACKRFCPVQSCQHWGK